MLKRDFLKLAAKALPVFHAHNIISSGNVDFTPTFSQLENENYWAWMRQQFELNPDYINLENGYYLMMPKPIMIQYLDLIRDINYQASRYMRTVQMVNKQKSVTALAHLAGCEPENLIITRNTTESLDMVINGQPWKAGDEAIMAYQDYGAMLDQFNLMAKHHKIKNIMVDIPQHPTSDDELVALYEKAITAKTKLIMVCHMINITGQIMPIKKLCDMAHSYGVKVMVDGAHAFAQLDFKISELNCDYYATSLHKWLCAPLGAGFLYIKNEHIASLKPLFASSVSNKNDIRHLNHTGTHPVHTDLAILAAIDFHKQIGAQRKLERLRYLKTYWYDQLSSIDNISMYTPKEYSRSGAIATVGIHNWAAGKLSQTLFDQYQIWTVGIQSAGVNGVRITPHLYTQEHELDKFVFAMKQIAAS